MLNLGGEGVVTHHIHFFQYLFQYFDSHWVMVEGDESKKSDIVKIGAAILEL